MTDTIRYNVGNSDATSTHLDLSMTEIARRVLANPELDDLVLDYDDRTWILPQDHQGIAKEIIAQSKLLPGSLKKPLTTDLSSPLNGGQAFGAADVSAKVVVDLDDPSATPQYTVGVSVDSFSFVSTIDFQPERVDPRLEAIACLEVEAEIVKFRQGNPSANESEIAVERTRVWKEVVLPSFREYVSTLRQDEAAQRRYNRFARNHPKLAHDKLTTKSDLFEKNKEDLFNQTQFAYGLTFGGFSWDFVDSSAEKMGTPVWGSAKFFANWKGVEVGVGYKSGLGLNVGYSLFTGDSNRVRSFTISPRLSEDINGRFGVLDTNVALTYKDAMPSWLAFKTEDTYLTFNANRHFYNNDRLYGVDAKNVGSNPEQRLGYADNDYEWHADVSASYAIPYGPFGDQKFVVDPSLSWDDSLKRLQSGGQYPIAYSALTIGLKFAVGARSALSYATGHSGYSIGGALTFENTKVDAGFAPEDDGSGGMGGAPHNWIRAETSAPGFQVSLSANPSVVIGRREVGVSFGATYAQNNSKTSVSGYLPDTNWQNLGSSQNGPDRSLTVELSFSQPLKRDELKRDE